MRRLGINEILSRADSALTKEEKISILREHDSKVLRSILFHVFDPKIKFLLPKGKMDYRPNEMVDNQNILYMEAKRLYLFVEGGHLTLNQKRREDLFMMFLENLDQDDAELMLSIKDKIMPYKSITLKLVREAFPDFLTEEVF